MTMTKKKTTTKPTTTTAYTDAEREKLAELSGKISDAVRSIATAAKKTIDDGRQAAIWLAECHEIVTRHGSPWNEWVRSNLTISKRYADQLRILADPVKWIKVERELAKRQSDARPMGVKEAIRIAEGKAKRSTRRGLITMQLAKEALDKVGVKMAIGKLLLVLAELGVKVEKEKKE